MAENDLTTAIADLAKARQSIESIRSNEALAARIVQLAQLLRRNFAASNLNCNCAAARFDVVSDPAQRA